MGLLAENKTRRKINKDPNNTKWTKDTNTFGQKILRAQGWQPGQFLGAQDAPHSELHTAANASYIRVVLKDDMKGLGFSKSKEDEITGLDVFQDLLSRLNGKTEDAIEEDQQNRLAVKTHHFVEQRYGPMRFVYGGLLVGDEMKEVEDKKAEKEEAETSSDEDVVMESAPTPKESKKEKKSKKRKASSDDEEEESSSRDTDSKSKKRRKEERKLKDAESDETKAKKKKEKKEKKDKSRKKSSAEASDDEDSNPSEERSKKRKSKSKDKSRSPEGSDEEKVKDKKSKKEKKEKKRRRKEEEAASTASSTPAVSVPGSGATTPSGTSTPRGSRNFVRSRFIAQKRQAVMDTKALNQIFMVKA
ncbi:pin2-interacting x1 [Fusarium longipes]|uniref:PinX1-related protein 1 n=1 Tax=Fusarium longipes TaxID=694270 RepID=A0A395RQQ4_9HYPO|nr:pin2-interacting x1 [Fusarium longipes]